jgi:hypothetical protein
MKCCHEYFAEAFAFPSEDDVTLRS